MEYRQFGRTDLKVSAIGFGCWEIGGTYGRIDEGEFQRAVARAIDSGHHLLRHGRGLRHGRLGRGAGAGARARRNEVVIATKFGVGYDEMPNRRDSSRARVLASIDKSLQRLRTDHVDIYLVHWPDPNTPLAETMAALDDVVRQGKVRYVGVSNFRLAQIEEAMRAAPHRCRAIRLEHVRPPHAGRDLSVLRGAADRRDGLRLARLRHAVRHVPRGHVVRRKRLALEGRQSRQPQPVSDAVRPRAFPAQSCRGRGPEAARGKVRKSLPQFALRWTLSNPVIGTAWSASARRPR